MTKAVIVEATATGAGTFYHGLYGGAVSQRRAHGKNRGAVGERLLDPFGNEDAVHTFRSWIDFGGKLEVDLGFGRGGFLVEQASRTRESRWVGFEVRTRLCMEVMDRLNRQGISNVRIIQADARPIVDQFFPVGSISHFYVGFPDPWWKKKHHKRRIFSPEFVHTLHSKLTATGSVILRTDVTDYAQNVREVFNAHGGFDTQVVTPDELVPTDRERRCADFGLPVSRLRFTKKGCL